MQNQVRSAKRKKVQANPGQLFWAFGPHQQGAAQSLPGTAGLTVSSRVHLHVMACETWKEEMSE